MTFFEQKGISIVATESIIPVDGAKGLVDDQLASKVNSYSHKISANNGFDECNFDIVANLDYLLEWLFNGLGRDITIYSPSGQIIWNGFTDQLSLTLDTLTISIGPLLDITNQCQVVYQTKTYNTNPPVGGQKGRTGFAANNTSVAQYGIFMRVVNGGEGTFTEMESLRDAYITENSFPRTSRAINSSGSNEPVLQVKCLGYVHMLTRSIYFELDNVGTEYPYERIINVLTDEPNGLFITPGDQIFANQTITVGQFANDNDVSYNIIKDAVSRGDSAGGRYTFGVYENRRTEYQPVHNHITYFYSIATNTYMDTAGGIVPPWAVVPARWIKVLDSPTPSKPSVREDPSSIYAESVTFTAPNQLNIVGGLVDSISQTLAQKGVGGSF